MLPVITEKIKPTEKHVFSFHAPFDVLTTHYSNTRLASLIGILKPLKEGSWNQIALVYNAVRRLSRVT